MFAQSFPALFSYPSKIVYGKALPLMADYSHFETAPSFYDNRPDSAPAIR